MGDVLYCCRICIKYTHTRLQSHSLLANRNLSARERAVEQGENGDRQNKGEKKIDKTKEGEKEINTESRSEKH